MAVTIDEMQVDVKPAEKPASAPASGGDKKKDVDVPEALTLIGERRLRLKAD